MSTRSVFRRPGLLLRSAFCLLLLMRAGAAHAQQDAHEEGIIEVVADRLAPITLIVLIDGGGSVLVPVQQIAAYLGLDAVRTGGTVTIPRLDGPPAVLDTAMPGLIIGRDTIAIAPAELVNRPDDIYLRIERLEQLIGGFALLDLARLTLALGRDVPFPAQQRVVAEQRRAMMLARQRYEGTESVLDTVDYPPVSGGAVLDWDVATTGLDPTRQTSLRAQLGTVVLGGDMNAAVTAEGSRGDYTGIRDVAVRYHRVFPHGTLITQARAGEFISTGLFARFMRGIEISNRPLLRGHGISDVLIRPDLPPGWEYEVFQGSQLLGFSETGSAEPVAVPLRAGATPISVRMYGPAGEEVVTTLLYQTPVSLIPRGATEYAAGFGRCDAHTCDRFAHADIRYGLTHLVTIGGGMELIADSAADHARPYVVSSFSTGTRAIGEITLMPGALYGANLSLFPRDGSTARLRANLSRPGFGPISLLPDSHRRWDIEGTWHERAQHPVLPFSQFRFGAGASGVADGLDRWRVSTAASVPLGYVELRYDNESTAADPHLVTARASIVRPVSVRGYTYRPVLNGVLGAGNEGFRIVELGTSVQPAGNAVFSAGVQWRRGNDLPAVNIAYTVRTRSATATVRAVASPRAGGSSAAVLSGSAALSSGGHITTHPSPRAGLAGVEGVVFVDHDGDGTMDAGEEAVPHANILVGSTHTIADESGRYRLWGLQPYAVTTVAIDSLRSADPAWTTARASTLFRPAPNTARRVDIALIRTRELAGSITAHADVPTVASLSLLITDLDSGDVITTTTFSDGQFYVSRIRPGRYRLTVTDASLAAIGARMEGSGVEFTIAAAGDDILFETSPLHLLPAQLPRP